MKGKAKADRIRELIAASGSGISVRTAYLRMNHEGMTLEEAATTPSRVGKHSNHVISEDGRKRIAEASRKREKGNSRPRTTYKAIAPNGREFIVNDLKKFCEERGWNHKQIFGLARNAQRYGHWTIKVIKNHTPVYRIESPTGETFLIDNLRGFCREICKPHELESARVCLSSRGSWKNWKATKV